LVQRRSAGTPDRDVAEHVVVEGEADDTPVSVNHQLIGFLAISSGSKYIELAGDEVDHRL
jgi:hypothetical protein